MTDLINSYALLPEKFSLDKTHLVAVRGLIHYKVSTKCINQESSSESRSYNRQVNSSFQIWFQDLSQYWLDKIRKALSSLSISLVLVAIRQYFPSCCVRPASEVSEEKGSYALRF